jgi:hypothetical protein
MLIQAMAKDLTRRGVRAIEAFGDRRWESPACVLPVDYLLAVGFKTCARTTTTRGSGWNSGPC